MNDCREVHCLYSTIAQIPISFKTIPCFTRKQMGSTNTQTYSQWDADLFHKVRKVEDVQRPERFVEWDRFDSNKKNKFAQNQFHLTDRTKPIAKPAALPDTTNK